MSSLHEALKNEIENPQRNEFKVHVLGYDEDFVFADIIYEEYEKFAGNAIDKNVAFLVNSCVVPDLNDKELQANYDVDNETDLLYKLIPNSKEFNRVLTEVKSNVSIINSFYEIADKLFKNMKQSKSDADVVLRSYSLTELNILPSEFDRLSTLDKAYIASSARYKSYQLEELRKNRG